MTLIGINSNFNSISVTFTSSNYSSMSQMNNQHCNIQSSQEILQGVKHYRIYVHLYAILLHCIIQSICYLFNGQILLFNR